MNAALRYGAVVLLALAAAATPLATRAGTGAMQLPATGGDGPVTVFYPTDAPDHWARRGPFTLPLAEQAAPVRGNGRLAVMSHGSGGTPWVHSDLAGTRRWRSPAGAGRPGGSAAIAKRTSARTSAPASASSRSCAAACSTG